MVDILKPSKAHPEPLTSIQFAHLEEVWIYLPY